MPHLASSPVTAGRRRGFLPDAARTVATTVKACFRYRVLGLAAETAFYALLSLPPLFFGLAGALGFVANSLSVATVESFRAEALLLASRFVTPDVVDTVLAPTLDDVLGKGRADVISIGFLLALWSGSRAMAVFVDTSTIMYGMRGERGMVKSRALAFLIYFVLLAAGAVIFPLVLAGPEFIDRVLPHELGFLTAFYWPIVLVGGIASLSMMFHLATPTRRRWRGDVPGALLAVGIWVLGSWALRLFLIVTLGNASLYGPLAAPIALLMWLYLIAVATLTGAAFNAAVARVWPAFSGLTSVEAARIGTEAATSATASH